MYRGYGMTCQGRLRPGLGDHLETDLTPALRPAIDPAALQRLFESTLQLKPEAHSFRANYRPQRVMTAIGGWWLSARRRWAGVCPSPGL